MHVALLVTLALAATFEPENLKGITSMRVIVEDVPGGYKLGLDPNLIQSDVEGSLTKAGLKISPIAGLLPYVYLRLNVLPLPDHCVVYSASVSLKAGATLSSTKKPIITDVWSDGLLRARCKSDNADVVKAMRQSILDVTEKLANDLLAANPR
jgi:hypothetical protein